ncbi:MAG: hypothetical protein K0Q79_2288 [Flavipsychrobacter sp.]|nr:hypothetical protein [Flavipsychrobacter sp.]
MPSFLRRGDRIRTCDPLVPNQVRYRPALLPEQFFLVLRLKILLAVREGFEPSIRINYVCQFSKLVDSASLPPHRFAFLRTAKVMNLH